MNCSMDSFHHLPAQFRGGKWSFNGLAKVLWHLTGLVVSFLKLLCGSQSLDFMQAKEGLKVPSCFFIYKRSLNVLGPEYMYLKLALKTL